MKFLIRFFLCLPLALSACTEAPGVAAERVRRASVGYSATFSSYPTDLYKAFAQFCTGPTKNYSRKSPNSAQCSEYLPPEPTAKVILRYNGVVSDLPKLIIKLSGKPTDDGYIVTTRNFLNVPQSDGTDLMVVFAFEDIERQLNRLFRMAGGTPL